MLYQVRAYPSRLVGESGRVQPSDEAKTGSFATAQHEAKALAAIYGASVLVNTKTGERLWFGA